LGTSGMVTVIGSGGPNSTNCSGVTVADSSSSITSNGGILQVIGTPGAGTNSFALDLFGAVTNTQAGGSIDLVGNAMRLSSGASVQAGANTVSMRPRFTNGSIGINLGGADASGTLGLTDAELDLVTAANLNIGSSTSGAITVSGAITRSAMTNVNLISG